MNTIPNKKELFDYYNERAPEYEAFYWGGFPAKIPNPDLYTNDTVAIQKLVPDYIRGKCIDIACGTGFWLSVYEKNCSRITLIDQSENVLAECTRKIHKLEIEDKTEIIRGDIFKYSYITREYHSAFLGFLISHLQDAEMDALFGILDNLLVSDGVFAIIDSVWNENLIKLGRNKTGMIKRSLKDKREFEIYKRYFDKQGLNEIAVKYNLELNILYWGNVFFLAAGHFQ